MPPDLKAHLRYPEDMFAIQANEYKTFHMTDPQVFYNREDLWASPNETYARRDAAHGALLHPDEAAGQRHSSNTC